MTEKEPGHPLISPIAAPNSDTDVLTPEKLKLVVDKLQHKWDLRKEEAKPDPPTVTKADIDRMKREG